MDGPREVRKTVTVVFADLVESTALAERLDPETLRHVLARYFDELRAALERHGGTVEKFIGDAVMAVFGVPAVHEDDALRAALAAVDMRKRIAQLNEEIATSRGVRLQIRIGINTGEVVAGGASADALVTGDAVNLAKRLEEAAPADSILIGEATRRLLGSAATVEALAPVQVRGKAAPVHAALLEAIAPAPSLVRSDTPFVGRHAELARLRAGYWEAVRERVCRLVTVVGGAGVGKSRLACELFDELGDAATILTGRCVPYGDGITFWPVTQIVREAGGDEELARVLKGEEDSELVLERLGGLTGRSSAAGAEETFWALRRVCEALARTRPLVICVEDIHWAEATLLDLLEYLAGWTRDAPILLLCLARPELLDVRPTWRGEPASWIEVEPLSPAEAETLIDALGVAPDARARVAGAAEGNPLFAEQLAAMLGEDGAADAIPPTIQALLAARLDRLPPRERAVVERAAVAGKEFWRSAVVALSPEGERAEVGAHLLALVRRGFVRPGSGSGTPDDSFGFAHVLVRDAAYAAIPKATRAELHERFAHWLESTPDDEPERDELVGYHLEQAYHHRSAVGPADDHGRELAARAAQLLAPAGRRASQRGDPHAAAGFLRRAAALVSDDAGSRLDLLVDLGSVLHDAGELREAEAVLASAAQLAEEREDVRAAARVRVEVAFAQTHTAGANLDHAVEAAQQAAAVLARERDEAGLARALAFGVRAAFIRCRLGETSDLARGWLEQTGRLVDVRQMRDIVRMLARAVVRGPTPVDEAVTICTDLRRAHERDPILHALLAGGLAVLEAMGGSVDRARALSRECEGALAEFGQPLLLALGRADMATVELLAQNAGAAVDPLRRSCDALQSLGEAGYLSTTAALLAEALLAVGDEETAERYTALSEEASLPADILSQTLWRATRAHLRARAGEYVEAERLARAAVMRAETTDDLTLIAGAFDALAAVLAAAGSSEAATASARARELHERKGNLAALRDSAGMTTPAGV